MPLLLPVHIDRTDLALRRRCAARRRWENLRQGGESMLCRPCDFHLLCQHL